MTPEAGQRGYLLALPRPQLAPAADSLLTTARRLKSAAARWAGAECLWVLAMSNLTVATPWMECQAQTDWID